MNVVAVDASPIQVDANKQRSLAGPEWEALELVADAKSAVRDFKA
jgi:hypothetical protein